VILVSPAEPAEFKTLGEVSPIIEPQYGADFLIPSPTGLVVAVQRKQFPGDFLGSVADGRFAVLLPRIIAADVRILLLEGQPRWTASGGLLNYDWGRGREFRRSHLRAMEWSLHHVWGVQTMWTDNRADSMDFLRDLARWAEKDKHEGLGVRPGPKGQVRGRDPSPRDVGVHLLSGIPGIGPETAGRVYDRFAGVPLRWTATVEDLCEVDGVGKGRAAMMTRYIPAAEPAPPDPEFKMEVSG
jgi:ERCC4-type nuclease